MDFAFAYLLQRFFHHVANFFYHWYVNGSRRFAHAFISTLEAVDRRLFIKATLYRRRDSMGKILGLISHAGRAIAGALIYSMITLVVAVAYAAWVAIPAILLFYVLRNL